MEYIEGTSNAATFTLPAPISVSPFEHQYVMSVQVQDNGIGGIQATPGVMGFSSIATTIDAGKTFSSNNGGAFGG